MISKFIKQMPVKSSKKQNRRRLYLRLYILAGIAVILIIVSLLAPFLVPNDPYATNASAIRSAPCFQYPFGTDNLGRCVFSRVLIGAGTSIFSAISLVLICFVIGTVLGLICGYFGGFTDAVIMRFTDVILAVPQMVLAIAVAGVLGGGMTGAMAAMGFGGWILFARLARGQVLAAKSEEYVSAARLGGKGSFRILFTEILPNIAGPLIVNAAIQIGTMMTGLAGLSFLGLGVQIPEAEWGSMINEARAYMQLAPWAVLAPAAAIIIAVMVFNYLGDTARDLLDIEGGV